jgi:hypothetical protein
MRNLFLEASEAGDLHTIQLMLAENPARITEADEDGGTAQLLVHLDSSRQ